ncbi:hypothetical protein V500_02032 [Pseudogymnoascus sp. VKM F-4518 (FW-2643)]|nr:hypothetical protein V500_02032 [Pseudogymnoascus sp. VKM F-4518 (FW-2643)]
MADELSLIGYRIGAASIGLGVFSTTIDLLHACKQGYDAWRGLKGLDRDLSILRAKLVLQQDLLEQWQRDWYGFAVTDSVSVTKLRLLKEHNGTVELALGSVHSLIDGMVSLREFAHSGRAPSGIERAKWIASELDTSRKSLNEITSLLEGLYRLLPPRSPNLEAAQAIISLNYHGEGSDAIETVLRSTSRQDIISGTLNLRRAERSLQQELQRRVTEMNNSPPTVELVIKPAARCQVGEEDKISAGFRRFGKLDGRPAIIEWKKYDRRWQGIKRTELDGRIKNLAHLLHNESKPEELRVLQCDGYFDNPADSRYGFVFTLPQPSEGYPISLREVIGDKSFDHLPTLEERYQIAYSLGLSIAILHTAGWLHKSIRSHNVLFLKQSKRPVWCRPYLVGFDYSRPDGRDESSEKAEQSKRFDIYRHPLSQGTPNERYRKEFDYYSFGAILVEIAGWRPIWDVWADGTPAETFKAQLLATAEQKVPHRMGRDYAEATLKCLNGELARRDCSEQKAFFIEVVEVLGRLIS